MSIAGSPDRRERCPLCGKPAVQRHRPFCGQGCRDRDLLKWLGDAYRVPGEPVPGEGDEGLDSGR